MKAKGVDCEPKNESSLASVANQIHGICKEEGDKKKALKKLVESNIKEKIVLKGTTTGQKNSLN